jgi:lysophospholipase L1-like esterase
VLTLISLLPWMAIGTVLLIVASELAARGWLLSRGRYYVLKPFTTTVMKVDKETLPDLEDVVTITINGQGERGDEAPAKGRDVYRVLVAGGSAAECYLLDQQSTWPHVLQTELKAEASRLGAQDVHVGSIARSLVACEYIELMLRKVVPRYDRLDLCVLMVGASDVVHWLEKKTPREIRRGQLSVDYVFDVHPEGPYGWTVSTMALRQILSRWYRAMMRPVGHRGAAGRTIAANREMRARARTVLNVTPDHRPMTEYFEESFRKMVAAAQEGAKRVLVVRQPWFHKKFSADERKRLWNFGAGRPYVEEVTVYYAHRVVNELLSAVDAVESRVCEEMGVEQLALNELLERSFDTYYDYLHFTPKGARDVGQAVARAVLGDPPLPVKGEPVANSAVEPAEPDDE